jgi:hypothetical protein
MATGVSSMKVQNNKPFIRTTTQHFFGRFVVLSNACEHNELSRSTVNWNNNAVVAVTPFFSHQRVRLCVSLICCFVFFVGKIKSTRKFDSEK